MSLVSLIAGNNINIDSNIIQNQGLRWLINMYIYTIQLAPQRYFRKSAVVYSKNIHCNFKNVCATCYHAEGYSCSWSDTDMSYQVLARTLTAIAADHSEGKGFCFLGRASCSLAVSRAHTSGRFCKICLKEAQATTWASDGRLASDWISFFTIVFRHW